MTTNCELMYCPPILAAAGKVFGRRVDDLPRVSAGIENHQRAAGSQMVVADGAIEIDGADKMPAGAAHLHRGRVVETGSAEQICTDPHEPYTPPGLEYPRVRILFEGEELAVVRADGRGVSLPMTVPPGRNVLRRHEA